MFMVAVHLMILIMEMCFLKKLWLFYSNVPQSAEFWWILYQRMTLCTLVSQGVCLSSNRMSLIRSPKAFKPSPPLIPLIPPTT